MVRLTDTNGEYVFVDFEFVKSISEFSCGTLLTFKDHPDLIVEETIHEIAMKARQ